MLQVFRLVKVGRHDQVIAFDELPRQLLVGIRKHDESKTRGLREWLKSKDCLNKSTIQVQQSKGVFESIEISFPFTYFLEYNDVNQDHEKWQAIVNYVRRVVNPDFRLMDKIEDMAMPMAADCASEMTLEPEMIPVIPVIAPLATSRITTQTLVNHVEDKEEIRAVEEIKRKRGRPKKVLEATHAESI